ncbi:hypothetical protein CBM2606_A120052 [Cupriavidus taiwanensis]|nr:hypothetical protein CBM2606_A120052 [Cupriavidus taiwanensis]
MATLWRFESSPGHQITGKPAALSSPAGFLFLTPVSRIRSGNLHSLLGGTAAMSYLRAYGFFPVRETAHRTPRGSRTTRLRQCRGV